MSNSGERDKGADPGLAKRLNPINGRKLVMVDRLRKLHARKHVIANLTGYTTRLLRSWDPDALDDNPDPQGRPKRGMAWYHGDPRRLIHCLFFHELFAHQPKDRDLLPIERFVGAYEAYLACAALMPGEPMDVDRAYYVIEHVRQHKLLKKQCKHCLTEFLDDSAASNSECHGCRDIARCYCADCGEPLGNLVRVTHSQHGRTTKHLCDACKQRARRESRRQTPIA